MQESGSDQDKVGVETRARQLGWVPKDEWTGDEGKWRDAEKFIEVGEKIHPILRQNLRRLGDQVVELKESVKKSGETISAMARSHKTVEARAYKKALTTLKKEQLDAVDAGDVVKFKKVDAQIEELTKGQETVDKADSEGNGTPALSAWSKDNTWYGDDVDMTIYADHAGQILKDKNPDWTPQKTFEKVTELVKKKFPENFGNQRRTAAAAVEADTGAGAFGQKGSGRAVADLPADAQTACKEFVAAGEMTEKQYLETYQWD